MFQLVKVRPMKPMIPSLFGHGVYEFPFVDSFIYTQQGYIVLIRSIGVILLKVAQSRQLMPVDRAYMIS